MKIFLYAILMLGIFAAKLQKPLYLYVYIDRVYRSGWNNPNIVYTCIFVQSQIFSYLKCTFGVLVFGVVIYRYNGLNCQM